MRACFIIALAVVVGAVLSVSVTAQRRHGALIDALAKNNGAKSPAAWRGLCNELREGESVRLDKDLPAPSGKEADFSAVDRFVCRRIVMELTLAAVEPSAADDASASAAEKSERQRQLADDWAALGSAMHEAVTRKSTRPLHVPAGGFTLARNVVVKSAKECFLNALELAAAADKNGKVASAKSALFPQHAAAWRGLGMLLPPNAPPSRRISLARDDGGDDAASSVTRVECFVRAIESPGGNASADAWFQLGLSLKEQDVARKQQAVDRAASVADFLPPAPTTQAVVIDAERNASRFFTARTALHQSILLDHTVGEVWLHMGEALLQFASLQRGNGNGNRVILSEADYQRFAASDDADEAEELSIPLLGERMNAKRCFALALRYNMGLGDAWHRLAEATPAETAADRAEHAAELTRRAQEKARRHAEREVAKTRRAEQLAERLQKQQQEEQDEAAQKKNLAAKATSSSEKPLEADDDLFAEEDAEEAAAASTSSPKPAVRDYAAEAKKKEDKIEQENEEEDDRVEEDYTFRDRRRRLRFVASVHGAEHDRRTCLVAAIEAVRASSRLGAAWTQLGLAVMQQGEDTVFVSGAQLSARDCLVAGSMQDDERRRQLLARRPGESAADRATRSAIMLNFAPQAFQVLCDQWRATGSPAHEVFAGAGWAAAMCNMFPAEQ